MHDSAALLERNFIHQRSHQVNAATVSGHPVLGSSRVGYRTNLEAVTLIPNRHRDLSICTAAHSERNMLARVLLITMDDGIQECFPQSHFDIYFGAVRPSEDISLTHQLINERRHRPKFTWERKPQLHERVVGTSYARAIDAVCV